jgi:DNA-binding transcriptional MerR regulator
MQEMTVGQVAAAAGVSVRTLHHYDRIGLVVPSSRDSSGYRRYDDDDIDRLQRVLAYRAMDVDLETIAEILDGAAEAVADHLADQLGILRSRIASLQRVERTLEATMSARKAGLRLTGEEMLEVFGDFDPAEHADEAQSRWGTTDAYRESARRVKDYTKADWLESRAEGEAAVQLMLAAFIVGETPDSEQARAGALAHRAHIDRWFYPCSAEMHCGLADMYIADERFSATYEGYAPGFAQFVHDSIYAAALA